MNFEELKLTAPILTALREQGYTAPTPIQEKAIPPALEGRDVLGCAQTGTGKTCAFAVPILQRLGKATRKEHSIRALILTPTRELAIQIQECFEGYGAHLPLRSAVIFGGVGQNPQVEALKRGVDILVATPGRLADLYNQKFVNLSQLEIFVLDEADRMLDMGFIHDVKKILAWLPKEKQTLFFSATMPPEITELVNSLLKRPVRVAVNPVSSPVEVIDQKIYFVDKGNKTKLLASLVADPAVTSALVFTRTKHGANKVANDLTKAGVSAAAIHGNKSQTARQAALAGFKEGSVRVLVATDIAARGLDIEELSHVFNYNLPEVPETYVHRIGRTGRAGREGAAISFCDFSEKPLLKDIEKLMGRPVPVVEGHPWPMQVFEAPKRDRNGRVVNEEDAEARAAARERKAQRQRAAGAKTEAARGASKGKTEAEPLVPLAAPQESQRRHPRPKRKTGGLAAIEETLRETAPARPAETAKLKETARRAQPAADDRDYQDPLGSEVIMDATARMLSGRKRYIITDKGPQPISSMPAPEPEEPKAAGHKKKRSRSRKKPASEPETSAVKAVQQKQEPAQGRLLAPEKKKRRRPDRMPPAIPRSLNARQKDSTEQKSLMKPYYITKGN
ncbi:MAG: DEAD/DEAH box helicase [Oscillospiraceae bacterium]|nr:DEAD/DEAH box helicase [Oscillospiraceae bacterium]